MLKFEPHVLVDDSASVGRTVINGCLDMGEAPVRLHEETYLGLGPPNRSAHLVIVKRSCVAAAENHDV